MSAMTSLWRDFPQYYQHLQSEIIVHMYDIILAQCAAYLCWIVKNRTLLLKMVSF